MTYIAVMYSDVPLYYIIYGVITIGSSDSVQCEMKLRSEFFVSGIPYDGKYNFKTWGERGPTF